ncbi:mediator of RNA polymerase II transcription subunit 14 [Aspergillus candidus]|uniref:Mediator of RNA polymerase II transcription subunit 14 n=1 Tax=Aspergillus candidus TaxID=41067 RepID=A0A2I2F4L5_ASPCN|nr:mediator of RNA polymerase II transcription subunit 14 [Aspergillus candidus]PLB35516.1 mediator of RNA polymerase II transcription subunit 14 [Aspergillus candidus]
MPGVVMDNVNAGGVKPRADVQDSRNGIAHPPGSTGNIQNGSSHVNGGIDDQDHKAAVVPAVSARNPPELLHITQGFFPFSTLINRSVQQCWNDLSELITELAEVQVPSQGSGSPTSNLNGKTPGNQSPENLQKKLRVLNFAHAKRAEFIKLLVLSRWSRQAADVSKLIDLQNFIRIRHQAYVGALQSIGDMKRDLVQAQVANPDLQTALEVLSKGQVVSMPDLGYKPPRPLTAKGALKRLKKINRIISVRLALHDAVPPILRTYHVHDGRVTFSVPGEFELDLSIGEENELSQFYFVDVRFLFTPSSPIPSGRVFNELDIRINDILRNDGLAGCFHFLHSLVLTNKVNILFKQAVQLARGLWTDILHVELLHRTLVVQYWALKPGAKSWLEIGVKCGRRKTEGHGPGLPYLGLRWLRDGQEADSEEIQFDAANLSMEHILRSAIALHISHILSSAYDRIIKASLFAAGTLSLRAQVDGTEPGDCQLDVQLTTSRHARVSIEPMSGAIILSTTPNASERPDGDRSSDRTPVDDIVSRVSRLRCVSAIEQVESSVKMFGFHPVSPRGLMIDFRKIFPPNVLKFSFFSHHLWKRDWMIAATSSVDGDSWWIVHVQSAPSPRHHSVLNTDIYSPSTLHSAQPVSSTLLPVDYGNSYASLADLGHCLSGILAVYANAVCLAGFQGINFHPHLHRLRIGSDLKVPDIFVKYDTSNVPHGLQVSLPSWFKKRDLIKDTVRIAFHGIDPRKKVAIMVAYGTLSNPVKVSGTLPSKWDHSVTFQKKGSGFAIRLLAPVGSPVILELFESLQRLECVLSMADTLQAKKMELRKLSLSGISFAYGPGKNLAANIEMGISRVQAEAPSQLRLNIQLPFPNSHRRIQASLADMLNRASTADAGLDSVSDLLSLTLPLMLALDQITANPSRKDIMKVQVIVRNARNFRIHYPGHQYRFQLLAGQYLGRMAWILKDASGPQGGDHQEQLRTRLKSELYDSKGEGWKGLGNGAVADFDKVGNLIAQLDKIFHGNPHDMSTITSSGLEGELKNPKDPGLPLAVAQPNGNNSLISPARPGGNAITPTGPNVKAGGAAQNADFIMID